MKQNLDAIYKSLMPHLQEKHYNPYTKKAFFQKDEAAPADLANKLLFCTNYQARIYICDTYREIYINMST